MAAGEWFVDIEGEDIDENRRPTSLLVYIDILWGDVLATAAGVVPWSRVIFLLQTLPRYDMDVAIGSLPGIPERSLNRQGSPFPNVALVGDVIDLGVGHSLAEIGRTKYDQISLTKQHRDGPEYGQIDRCDNSCLRLGVKSTNRQDAIGDSVRVGPLYLQQIGLIHQFLL